MNEMMPSATELLSVLDRARTAVCEHHVLVAAELETRQSNIARLQSALDETMPKVAALAAQSDALTIERDELTTERAALVEEREALKSECDALEIECAKWRNDCESQCAAHAQTRAEHEKARADHKRIVAEIAMERARVIKQHEKKLEKQAERTGALQRELMTLYKELRASDLPSLVLRICVALTESECGLFVEADGDGTLADIGLHDLPPEVQESLYQWTRRAAEANAPVTENDGQKLADGQDLINLAALPVAVQSTLKGVILVANKRSGPYLEQDTELLLSIGRHAGVALENQRLHGALADSFHSTIAVLADAIEAKDAYTRGHCDSVAKMAVEVARRLGVEADALDQIRYAALLHDVGKIGIPDGILLKPGKLMPEEYLMIQRHSSIGSDLVSRVPSLQSIAPIILHHHERIDGAGYPSGQLGEGIELASRIICVVDAFDAMTTPRPYREPVSHAEAIKELQRCAGTHFDGDVVATLSEMLSAHSL